MRVLIELDIECRIDDRREGTSCLLNEVNILTILGQTFIVSLNISVT